jgi:predicted peptidase
MAHTLCRRRNGGASLPLIGLRWIGSLSFCLLLCSHLSFAQSGDTVLLSKTYRYGGTRTMPYRLFVPGGYAATKRYPLVLWLHGARGRGSDNIRNISGQNRLGSHIWTLPANQKNYPCFVVAPQCPDTTLWVSNDGIDTPPDELDAVVGLLRELEGAYSIDTDRVYVAGQSMGGVAVWEIVARYPALFAAALPLCAIGNTDNAKKLAGTPVWAFHGAADDVVPVAHAREIVGAVKLAGGHPKYTEYPGVGHDVWNVAFKERTLLSWLFSQRRTR